MVLVGDQNGIISLMAVLCHKLVLVRLTALEENYRSSIRVLCAFRNFT